MQQGDSIHVSPLHIFYAKRLIHSLHTFWELRIMTMSTLSTAADAAYMQPFVFFE
jgi:hypothetical protein